jgi:glycosyltransferase involved in cell wall biosynthesis
VPRVLLVTQDLQRAGAQRQCVELALGLKTAPGWEVEVAVLEAGGPLAGDLARGGVRIHDCPRRWRWDLSPARRLADLVREGRHAILHSLLFLPNFYGRVARLMERPPVVISSLRSTGIEGLPRYLAEILMAPLSDLIIANSEAGRRDLIAKGVRADRIVVVRNGIDLAPFLALAPRDGAPASRRLGMVAQMESRKDQAGLVRAFASLAAAFPDARLVLAGDGRLRVAVEQVVRDLAVEGRVDLPGTVDDPRSIYGTLDLYVQASASEEGTSNSIVEAMASGLPVVATDVGGNSEVVEDGVTGRIVPPHRPDRLAAAIAELLRDSGLRRRMGDAGRERAVRHHTRDALVRSTLEVYARALEGAAARIVPGSVC